MAKARRYSLRFTIASLVVALLLATVAGVLVIAFLIRSRTITETAKTLQAEISTRITERIVERFAPMSGLLRRLVASAEAGRMPVEDEPLLRRLVDFMRFEERVEWLAWLRPDGTGVGVLKHPDGILAVRLAEGGKASLELWAEDGTRTPRPTKDLPNLQQVPWVTVALDSEGPAWTDSYIRPWDDQPGRACALALRRDGEVRGVFGLGFGVAFLRSYLNSIQVGETGAVFGVHKESGRILTSPSNDVLARMGPAVDAAVASLPGGLQGLEPGVLQSIPVSHAGISYRVGLAFQAPEDMPSWLHAIVVRESELVGYFAGYFAGGLVAVALLLAVAIGLARFLSRRVSRSLDSIAEDLGRIGDFELEERPATNSMIREVAVVGDATERMKASLRSFSRYVPTELVRDLLSQGQEARLGGVQRPLTLFFSDIAGFTTASEGMQPPALVDALGEYLDVLTRAVESNAGTIDKFIGDGVLAFFNAPRDDADHVRSGCRAALAVQAALADAAPDWSSRGLPEFATRIGLHTAEVVVGNIGTPERFAYTVIGDGVNLAARLESINKAYGTSILTSEDVRKATGDAFVWRRIDRTAVVGRAAGVTVYELLGQAGEVDERTLEQSRIYERALTHYFERRFAEAAEAFALIAPVDKAATVLGARASAYATAPPPADWSGIHVQTMK